MAHLIIFFIPQIKNIIHPKDWYNSRTEQRPYMEIMDEQKNIHTNQEGSCSSVP